MSVTLAPYGDALYGGNNYGGIQVTSFGFFDLDTPTASPATGSPTAATYDYSAPTKGSS